ncbi:MAG: hypothetical protein KC502_09845 [Myxococcales bacterium]|nr:hypothetical protein [Myxococcales bacterium]
MRCEDLLESWGVDVVRYSKAGRSALVLDGCTTTALGHVAEVICANKRATCALLSELALPVPNAVVVEPGQSRAAILRDLPSDRPLVCKPLEGTNGEGVVMGLVDDAAIVEAVEACWRRGPALVEAQIPGADLRIHVIGRRVVAACERRPAAVTGDGRSTVAELVAARDAEVQAHNPQNRLQLDAASHALLAAAGCTLSDVLAKGRVLPLKTVANIAQGATPVDITHLLHPRYQAWVARIGASLSLDIFALDVLALDPMADPAQGGAVILEVNARPQWLHHTFSQGQTHDVAAMLLTALLEDR